jgi:hypothetical protein
MQGEPLFCDICYIARYGERLIILRGGGIKKGQKKAIDKAEAIRKTYSHLRKSDVDYSCSFHHLLDNINSI